MTTHSFETRGIGDFTLHSGKVLRDLQVAYVSHGHLNADGSNAILVTHGYTSGPSMLSLNHHTAEGSWANLLGPSRPLDTDRYFIVCTNMLGSSFGTTGPQSINPETGMPWGPQFPNIKMTDIVGVQHQFLKSMGVNHLRAVVGPSYGGWQALQWAIAYPHMVDAAGVIVSGLKHPDGLSAQSQLEKLKSSPEWRDGLYPQLGGMPETLFEIRMQTMRNYGLERLYEDREPDALKRQEMLAKPCRDWASKFDPYSLVALAGAAESFNVETRMSELQARLLLMVCTTDAIFPPNPKTTELVNALKVPHRYVEIDSPYGHMASGIEWRQLEPQLTWLINGDEKTQQTQ